MIESFYSGVAGAAFTLLGLWWVVIEFRAESFLGEAHRRRMAHALSLHFLLLGTMSLLALLSTEGNTIIWRGSFMAAGVLGIVATLSLVAAAGGMRVVQVGGYAAVVLYGLVVLFASFPALVGMMGVTLRPIELEAILVSVLLFLGANFAWFVFMEPMDEGVS